MQIHMLIHMNDSGVTKYPIVEGSFLDAQVAFQSRRRLHPIEALAFRLEVQLRW
jgi:hypothetical protein